MAFELFVGDTADCWITKNCLLYWSARLRKRPPWKDALGIEFYYEPNQNLFALRPVRHETPHMLPVRRSRYEVYVPFSAVVKRFPEVFAPGAKFLLRPLGLELEPLYQLVPLETVSNPITVPLQEVHHA